MLSTKLVSVISSGFPISRVVPFASLLRLSVPLSSVPIQSQSQSLRSRSLSSLTNRNRGLQLNSSYTLVQNSRQLSFKSALEKLKSVKDVDSSVKLQLYALFKQATIGKNTTSKPGMMDFVAKAKWDAWTKLGDMKKENAEAEYVKIVESMLPKEGEAPAAKPEGGQAQSGGVNGLDVTVKDGIRTILLNRPDKFNALTREMYGGIQRALLEANDDENTKIVVLTGAGKFYCSGNDLSNFANVTDVAASVESGRVQLRDYVAAYIDCRKPLIALVNGPALGVAVTVFGLCDAVYCTDRATFTTPFSSLGQSPEGCSSYTFPKIMGYAKASELLYFNSKITAQQAYDWGLVTEVIPDDRFQAEAWAKVKQIAELPLKSLVFSKELVRGRERKMLHEINEAEAERLKERWASEDCMEAIMKFMSRKSKM